MTNTKTTKRALFASVLSLLLCISMLVGSTFAWFTDSASTSVNKIQAGNLDIALEMYDEATKSWVNAEGETLDFIKAEGAEDEEILWEPGCTYKLPDLRIVNNGDLHLKYMITITGIDGDAKLNEAIEWTYGAYNEPVDTYVALAPKATSKTITIQGHMKEEAGNEYQGLSIDGISITVFATQVEAEYDSFDNQYDKNAPDLISINGKSYTTLNEAIEAAAEGDVITVGGSIPYDMGNTTGGKDWGKVSIVAETNSGIVPTITFTGYGSANPLKNAKVSGVKIVDNTVGDNEGAWEHGYFEVEGGTFTNVEFVNAVQANGTVTFSDCTFNGNADQYAAWVNSGNATFNNCTFVGARALKAHEAYGSEVTAVTVDGCIFDNISKKPGIALGDLNAATSVTIKDSTFNNVQAGDQGKYIYESDTNVTTFTFVETNNTVLGVEVANQSALQEAINNGFSGVVLPAGEYTMPNNITNKDIVISGDKDTVIDTTAGMPGTTGADITFDGVTINFKEGGSFGTNGFTHSEKVVYKDCVINGTQFLYSEAEFINCTFNVEGDAYAVWTYGSPKATFTDCTFNTSGKAILVYIEKAHTATITVDGCTFNCDGAGYSKAAVEVGESAYGNQANYTINITDSTADTGFTTNNSTSNLWGNKNSMPEDRLVVTVK